jgi:signal transduction histidine kinase
MKMRHIRFEFALEGVREAVPAIGEQFKALRVPYLVRISFLVALGYYLGSRIGFLLTPAGGAIATYWTPNSILLASFLLVRPRRWWVLIVAVLAAHLLAQTQNRVPITTVLGWFISNASEALLGAAILYRIHKQTLLFSTVRGILFFLLFGVFLAPFITSFLDAGVVVITRWGTDYWMLWLTRLFSNMLAFLTIVPAVTALGTNGVEWWRKATRLRVFEAVMLAASLVPVTIFAYGGHYPPPYAVPPLVYAPLPFLLWASLRFGTGCLAASVTTITVIAFHYVMQGRGPFAAAHMTESVLFLQILLLVMTVPLLLLTAVLSERQRAERQLRANRAKLVDAEEQERRRIARELHDDIGQQLTLVELELRGLNAVADKFDSSAALKGSIEKVGNRVAAISEATRELSHGLHPGQLEFIGLAPAIKSFCAELQQNTRLQIHVHEKNLPARLDWDISLCLFRVAQEALHNVVRHSQAKSCSVHLSLAHHHIVLRITDDGIGFASKQEHPGLGLINMSERLELLGGKLKLGSAPQQGTIVQASVPLRHTDAA